MHPSESGNAEPDMNNEKEAKTESIAASSDPSVQMEADLKAARAEAAEWQDRFLRKAAELENFRKRMEKEKVDSMALAKSSLLIEFLPVADACERALLSMEDGENSASELEQYKEGVELLYKQLLDTLSRAGVAPIESVGRPFDPRVHEALSRKEDPNYEVDTVIQELRRGYCFKDRLLRPAQVIVAVKPESRSEES